MVKVLEVSDAMFDSAGLGRLLGLGDGERLLVVTVGSVDESVLVITRSPGIRGRGLVVAMGSPGVSGLVVAVGSAGKGVLVVAMGSAGEVVPVVAVGSAGEVAAVESAGEGVVAMESAGGGMKVVGLRRKRPSDILLYMTRHDVHRVI